MKRIKTMANNEELFKKVSKTEKMLLSDEVYEKYMEQRD